MDIESDNPAISYRRITSLAFGGMFGILTMTLEHLNGVFESSVIEAAMPWVTAFLFPGILGSMAVSGNAHAFHLWVAAVINGVFYFVIAWVVLRLIGKFFMRKSGAGTR